MKVTSCLQASEFVSRSDEQDRRPSAQSRVDRAAIGAGATYRFHLTPRQLEVLALLCEGLSNKLICRRLGISACTVKIHITSIFRELGVTSRLQAVVLAHRLGLTHADEGERSQHVTPRH